MSIRRRARPFRLATAEELYAEHREKSFYDELVRFITRGPVLLAVGWKKE